MAAASAMAEIGPLVATPMQGAAPMMATRADPMSAAPSAATTAAANAEAPAVAPAAAAAPPVAAAP
eukprot:1227603-Prymnesium_polylepis.1